MKRAALFFLLALAAFPVHAETAPQPPPGAATDPFANPLIREIEARHELGVAGDKKAVTDLIADLERLTQEQPQNQLLRAYLGSAYTLLSRDLFYGPGKLRALKLGLHTLDDAVAAAPDDIAVRFIRAVNNFNMPIFVNRKETARADFEILVKAIRAPAVAAGLNPETRQAIDYYAGLTYRQLHQPDEAAAAWRDGLALGAATPLGQKIAAELAKLKP